MTLKKNTIEPFAIVCVFTISTLINRSRDSSNGEVDNTSPDASEPLISRRACPSPEPDNKKIENWLPYPDTSKFHNNITSRILRKFPFLIETWYWALTYWPYQMMRAYAATYINSSPERKAAIHVMAKENALHLLRLEEMLGLNIEQPLQNFILTRCPQWVMTVLCDVYLAHITVGIAFLGYGYTYFPRHRYKQIRRTIAIDNFLAFFVLTLYRCTPPRLMPPSFNFNDVLHPRPGEGVGQPSDWANNRFQLVIAAMPSLHFGTSLLVGISIALWGRHAFLRSIAPFYPMTMLLVVLATANHWVLDCVAGVMVVATGLSLNWIMLVLRPIEEWVFWALRTEKPREWPVKLKDDV